MLYSLDEYGIHIFKYAIKGIMITKWLAWINYTIIGGIAILLLAAFFLLGSRQTDLPTQDTVARKSNMPKRIFARQPHEYDAISAPAFKLSFSPLSAQLPDLRRHLIYYGKNGRPDADHENPLMYLTFTGNKSPVSITPGKRLFVIYDKKQNPNQYVFSPNNHEAPLWLEATAQGNQAVIKTGMKLECGEEILEPATYAEFTLPEKEFVRFGGSTWELGGLRVDGTLLARQKARWCGVDRFIEKHGGEEYKDYQNKHRVDFGEGDEIYSVYLAQGSCLIWKNNRWQSTQPGEHSIDTPMLCVKKVDERVMNLELWDAEGKGKIVLNLIKTNETWAPKTIEEHFKFIGARTRSQFIFEIKTERMMLRPHDWLILTESGWKKLETADEIDQYVDRKLVGLLFVFDHIDKKDDKQIISGTLFNAARTEMVPIELSLQQNATALAKKQGEDKRKKGKDADMVSMAQKTKDSNISPMIKREMIEP